MLGVTSKYCIMFVIYTREGGGAFPRFLYMGVPFQDLECEMGSVRLIILSDSGGKDKNLNVSVG